jgi:nucleoside-diphosphate-sugar epimerase
VIGGTILTHLLKSTNPALKNATITCLMRGEDRIKELHAAYGDRVKAELYKDLDDTERTIEVASQHDIIINTTLGFHPESAAALVKALGIRKQQTGKDTFMIHTSGTSNMADYPISKQYLESRTFNDENDDIYAYEKKRNDLFAYAQRTSELGVVDAGVEHGVKTIVIMSPTIYGRGTGAFNKTSIQVPAYASTTLQAGHGLVVGDGAGIWDRVHIEDLAELYEIVLLDILEKGGADLPFGTKGIIFSGNGRFKWLDIAQGVADAAYKAGLIKSPEVKRISLKEGAELFPHGSEMRVELGLSSNSRTESSVARKLGWKPRRGDESWREGFEEEVRAAKEKLGL